VALQYSENNLVTTILSGPRRITNRTSQIANPQQFGLFVFSKLSANCLQNQGSAAKWDSGFFRLVGGCVGA